MAAPASAPAPARHRPALGLGLDVGGTRSRWALAGADGGDRRVFAEGAGPGWSGLMLGSEDGRAAIAAALADVARQAAGQGTVRRVAAGITGFDAAQGPALAELMAAAFGLPASALQAMNDIELACRAAFAPGEGLVLYAGTGSVAAAINRDGRLQRAGGRGLLIDDAGGGAWIAQQALRAVWRREDEVPGSAQATPLGQALYAAVGGSDWAATRAWVYGASRGELGTLALAVAQAAHQGDATALALLRAAGDELARLVLALQRRLAPPGPGADAALQAALPVVLSGRAWALHPAIEQALHAAVQAALGRAAPTITVRELQPHRAAARLAAAAQGDEAAEPLSPADTATR